MNRKVIAILGISGVGKTTMISSFVEGHPSVLSVSASNLLKEELSETNSEKLRKTTQEIIHSNQDKLVSAFQVFKDANPNKHIIFDGHSIIDNDKGIVVIPTEVFKEINPDHIIFTKEDSSVIASRRSTDTSRSRPKRTVEELHDQQILAEETARNYGSELSVPFTIVRSRDNEKLHDLLLKILAT